MILALALAVEAAPAPVAGASVAVTSAAADAGDPLAAARALESAARAPAPEPGARAVALLAFARLAQDPTAGESARAALGDLLLTLPPSPAWPTLYAAALGTAPPPSPRTAALRIHAALAAAHTPAGAATARTELEALVAGEPDGSAVALRARAALLLAGDAPPDAVDAAWRAAAAAPIPGIPPLTAPALLTAAGVPQPGPCERSASAGPCAEALLAAGLGARADRWLATLPPDAAPRAAAILATGTGSRGAAAAWARVAAVDRAGAVRALLDLGDDDGAAALAATDAEMAEATAVSRVRLSAGQPDAAAELLAAAAAWPDNAWIRARVAVTRADEGDAGGALDELLRLARLRTLRPAELGRLVEHAWAERAPERALPLVLAALDRADGPEAFGTLASLLPELLAGAAESAARAGDPSRAEALATTARAVGAVGGPVYLAGRAWAAGDTDAARALYEEALRQRPDDEGVRAAYLRLLAQRGEWAAARAYVTARGGAGQAEALRRLAALEELRAAGDGRKLGEADEARLTAAARPFADDEVAMALGDALLAGLRPAGAAVAYERAAAVAPGDPWPRVGLASALLLRGAPEDHARIGELLDGLARVPDDAVARRERELRIRWLRSGAAAAAAAGDDREAYEAYVALLGQDDSSAVRARLGELFLAHWQYAEAEASFREALRRVPVDEAAWAGLARSLAAAGAFDDAEAVAAAGAVGAATDAYGRTLSDELVVRRALATVGDALARGDLSTAELGVAALVADHPDDLEVRTAAGALALHAGRADDALAAARAVLAEAPTYAPALGLAVSAGWAAGRIGEVAPLLDAWPTPTAWVDRERDLARVAAAIASAEAEPNGGRRRAALAAVAVPDGDAATRARALLLLGAAEGRGGSLRAARAHFAAARALSSDGVDPVRAEADVLRDRRQTGAAIRLLRDAWETRRDPRLGIPLARHLRDAGRTKEAAAVLAEALALQVTDPPPWLGDTPPALPPLDPELLARRPDDRTAERPTSLLAPTGPPVLPPDGPERHPPVGEQLAWHAAAAPRRLADARELALAGGGPPPTEAPRPERFGPVDRAGVATMGRAGFSDETALLAVAVPVSRDSPVGPIRVVAEALPVWATDRAEGALAVAAALGAHSLDRGPLRWDARVGLSASEPGGSVDPTGHARAAWHPGLFGIGLSATRAPATQTRYAWAGTPDRTGRILDDWLEASVAYADHDGSSFGALGRIGRLTGPSLADVGWQQAAGWASRPFAVGPLQLTPGVDGHVQAHDRAAERFVADEAGVFTPAFAASARATVYARWSAGDLSLCAGGGGGAQWTRAQPWFVSADVHPAWTAGAGGAWRFAPEWRVTAVGVYESSEVGWGGAGVLVGVARGPTAPGLTAVPGPTLSSLVHGAPLRELGGCASEAR